MSFLWTCYWKTHLSFCSCLSFLNINSGCEVHNLHCFKQIPHLLYMKNSIIHAACFRSWLSKSRRGLQAILSHVISSPATSVLHIPSEKKNRGRKVKGWLAKAAWECRQRVAGSGGDFGQDTAFPICEWPQRQHGGLIKNTGTDKEQLSYQ